MGYLIKSNVINALEEDMQDTMICYKGKREKDIIAFCYESMERTIEELPQYRVDNVVEETGLTHEQIMELKGRDTAKAAEKYSYYGYFECPSCGEAIYAGDDFESHKFCQNCGQRLQWED